MSRVNEIKEQTMMMLVLSSLGLQPFHHQPGSDWRTIQALSQLFKRHCNDLLANQLDMLRMPH